MSHDTQSGDGPGTLDEKSLEPEALLMKPELPDSPSGGQEELPPPTGTLFLLMLYIMLTAGMWGGIYFDFLGR